MLSSHRLEDNPGNAAALIGVFVFILWLTFDGLQLGPRLVGLASAIPHPSSLIVNAGNARIEGIEADIEWAASEALTVAGGFAWINAALTENFCEDLVDGEPVNDCDEPAATKGTQLPVTPEFKGNVSARYDFAAGSWDAHVQGVVAYVGSRWADLRSVQREILGEVEAYTLANFTAGIARDGYTLELFVNNAFDERGQLDRWAQCDASVCGLQGTYITPLMPRTVGLRFGQKF